MKWIFLLVFITLAVMAIKFVRDIDSEPDEKYYKARKSVGY